MEHEWYIFTNKDLKKLIVPLFLEQLLVILVGLADTFVISFVSEAAVSGVLLVNSFNTIFIYLFTALAALVCVTMGPVFITVIGQCMGSGDTVQAEYYFRKLLKITLLISVFWNVFVFALTPVVMQFYDVAEETRRLTIVLVLIHNIFNCIAFPFADSLGKGLRAAGDVRFTTAVSVATTMGARLVFSILFSITLDMGVIGIAGAMCFDWCIRALIFYIRFKAGKWKQFRLI